MFSAACTLTGVEHVRVLLLYVCGWYACGFDIASHTSKGISLGTQISSATVLEE